MPRGQPQIDVCFDIDSNGILQVSALEKSTGKENKITITNDKGRLSQEEIERMVADAEKYKAEDDANKNRVEAKNALENYCFSLKSSISGDKIKNKLDPSDKAALESKIEETTKWLRSNQYAEKEEFDEHQKALSEFATPILQKLGSGGDIPGTKEGMSDTNMQETRSPSSTDPTGGPTIEEID